jgi:hypothetical protein
MVEHGWQSPSTASEPLAAWDGQLAPWELPPPRERSRVRSAFMLPRTRQPGVVEIPGRWSQPSLLRTEPWPLSAAATYLLLQPSPRPLQVIPLFLRSRTRKREVVRLALEELVLSGAWRIWMDSRRRRWGLPQSVLMAAQGDAGGNQPGAVAVLRSALFESAAGQPASTGMPLQELGDAAVARRTAVWRSALDELRERDLVRTTPKPQPFLPGELDSWGMTRTSIGDDRARMASCRMAAWRVGLETGGAAAERAFHEVDASPGLLLLLGRTSLGWIDQAAQHSDAHWGADAGARRVDWNNVRAIGGLHGLEQFFADVTVVKNEGGAGF